MNSFIKDLISSKIVFKTKGPYTVLYKGTQSSYWLQRFPFCEGLGRPRRIVKEPESSMGKLPYTMVIYKHIDGENTRFGKISEPLIKILWENGLY